MARPKTTAAEELDAALKQVASGESPEAPPEFDESIFDRSDEPERDDDVEAAPVGGRRVSESAVDELTRQLEMGDGLEALGPAPKVGGSKIEAEHFGQSAFTMPGVASSPRLFSSVSQFPTATQLRVWKVENGNKAALGAIDANCTDEDFVRQFYTAMPKPGEGKCTYILRPIDALGNELGHQAAHTVHEAHATLVQLRKQEELQKNPWAAMMGGGAMPMMGPGMPGMMPGMMPWMGQSHAPADRGGRDGPIIVQPQDSTGPIVDMYSRAQDAAEARMAMLEQALEEERRRVRDEEMRRAQEQVEIAKASATSVHAVTERMMKEEAERSERLQRAEAERNQTFFTTLTGIFAQQQTMTQQQVEAQQRADMLKIEQERARGERERVEAEQRMKTWLMEQEEKRRSEREEMEARRRAEREEYLLKAKLEREEAERRAAEIKAETERRMAEAKAEMERRALEAKMDADRRIQEQQAKLQFEAEQMKLRIEQERHEAERREKERRDEIERRDKERREESERRERLERDERERKDRLEREDRERREKAEREDRERREAAAAREHEMRMKEMELQAQKDREHSERMMNITKLELEKRGDDGLTNILTKGTTLLTTLGIQPQEFLARMLGGGMGGPRGMEEDYEDEAPPEPSSPGVDWGAMVPKVIEVVGMIAAAQAAKTAATGGAARPAAPAMIPNLPRPALPQPQPLPQQLPQVLPQGRPMEVGGEMRPRPVVRPQPMPQPVPQPVPQPAPPQAVQPAAATPRAEVPAPAPVPVVPPPAPAPPVAQPINWAQVTTARAAKASLEMKTQKKARLALRNLVRDLQAKPEEEWQATIAGAISLEFSIYHYAKAVSVRTAMLEAGATDDLANRVINAMRASGMVPEDMVYDMEDA